MNYGIKIRELRDNAQLTQEYVADVLGISRSTYKDYETQTTIIPIKHLVSLCDYYNISIDYLFDLTDRKQYEKYNSVNYIEAGKRLKEFRKEYTLTQHELAQFLNVSFSSIAFNEKGRNLISTSFLYAICKKYNISADYLLGRVDKPKYLK